MYYLLQKFTGIISEEHTFIGGSDANHEGLWKWDDGEPFTFTDWAPNEPNGDTGENCLKVSQFQNEFMKSSFLPKYEKKLSGFLPCVVRAEIIGAQKTIGTS